MTKQNDSNRAGAILTLHRYFGWATTLQKRLRALGGGSFGHAKTRPGGIWRDGFEELNWVAPYDRLLPLGERPTQFRQGDILQLPDPLSGHSEFLSNFFESFRFAAVQPEREQHAAEPPEVIAGTLAYKWYTLQRPRRGLDDQNL